MPRVVLGVAYNGSTFEGWQTQPHGRTVQDTLSAGVARINGEHIRLFCAGRTDTGVHARQQVVHFDTEVVRPISAWTKGVNQFMPESVVVTGAKCLDDRFHARYGAESRTYRYYFYTSTCRDPLKPTMTWVHYSLDLDKMRQASSYFLGTHDFSAFRSSQCQAKSPVRTILSITLQEFGSYAYIEIKGNAFLHHMVRNLVAVLFQIGMGKNPVGWAQTVLESKRRECASRTYPSQGLTLWSVVYPKDFGVDALFLNTL